MIVWCFEIELKSLLQSNIVRPFKDDACPTSFNVGRTIHIQIPPLWGGLGISNKVCYELGLHETSRFILDVKFW